MRALTFVALAAPAALAGTSDAHADWLGKAEAGFVNARGNTETDTGNAKFDIAYELEKWKHSLYGAGLYANSNDIKSAERWETRWQSDYKLTERLFTFGALRYEQDHFSGFDYQGSASVGVGYKFIDTQTTKLTGTLGVGYNLK
jgi:putative salt-induced outer membrane protein